jgi:diadenosine tetraphosphate (Ap4A) HIT family hydrolase
MTCPFCAASPERFVAENQHAIAVLDGYPVNPGHTLVCTRRHIATWFDASTEEQRAIMELIAERKQSLDQEHAPDGYNIGINVGESAGQTIDHLHVHLVPRFVGDVDDPTGGVRLVIPERGNYKRPGFIPRGTAGGPRR